MENNIKEELFGDIDFTTIANDDNFKEDSVRERIIMPIIKKLGFTEDNIERSKSLKHPFLQIGSDKEKAITLIPDYTIKIGDTYHFVLDAKSPKQKIFNNKNVEQVYSYAVHPEIKTKYFALCNGVEFIIYETFGRNTPLLHFRLKDIESNWKVLQKYLSINSFQTDDNVRYEKIFIEKNKHFDYKNRPLPKETIPRKRAVKRYYGCNAYFTRQAWNVVQEYIKNYTQPGDLVLDPFGGSGITAIEAMMTERKSIHIDLNPLSKFMVDGLVAPVGINDFVEAFENIKNEYLKKEPKTKEEIEKTLKTYKGCNVLPLPKSSDVPTTDKLFTKEQMAKLSLLKSIIKKQKNINIQNSMLLVFYNTISMCNKTFHEMPSGGWANFVMCYRYRIAKIPAYKNVIEIFESRFKKILDAKKEMEYNINDDTIENIQVIKGTATDLSFIKDESVDYIYTDPPYGKKIPYLDLSTMWNAWLDLDVTEEDYNLEAIEGGTHNKTKESYKDLIAKSIKEMYRVLKFDRWMSFVFAHKDPEFWHTIIDAAENCGFEYVGTVSQKNGQESFKKWQHPFTVLSGQLIINFKKASNPISIAKEKLGMKTYDIVMQSIEGIIAKNNGATLEEINEAIIKPAMKLGFLHKLAKEYSDLTPLLRNNFDYNSDAGKYFMHKNKRFTTHIPLGLRVEYYVKSYLAEMNEQGINPTFDDVVKYAMPLLKNGVTPKRQTILKVLEGSATRVGKDGWKLSNGELF